MGNHALLHPTEQTLSDFSLGKLDDTRAELINSHLNECPECQRRVAEMSSDSFLGRLQGVRGGLDTGPVMSSSLAGLSRIAGEPASAEPPPASSLPPGLANHPDYEVIRELGQGGMGTVYLAQNRLMGRNEVLKVVSGHLIKRRSVLDRFQVEIRNAARLHHTNIVTAYSASRLGESIVFAMEYVDGLDLSKLVKAKGPLPVANACNYVHQACLGLQHAHEQGMVHRDIKPSNLMLARQGQRAVIKVLDFGLAKIQSEGPVDGGLTHEGQMLGTPDYIAPEQIRDARGADIRADIYSLGCTLYYLLSGGPPFPATSLYDLLQAHHSMDAAPLNLARPEVPVELAALVGKMMAKEPERRFQTPSEVSQALARFFKPAAAQPSVSEAEVSRVQSQVGLTQSSGVSPAPSQPATFLSVPATAGRGPSKTGADGVAWRSLIEIKEDNQLPDSVNPKPAEVKPRIATDRGRRPRWFWPVAAAGVLLLGTLVACALIIKVTTKNGVIVFEGLSEQAEVFVDGEKVSVRWPDGGTAAEVTAPAGTRHVVVKKDGITISSEDVRIEVGRKFAVRIHREPLRKSQSDEDERISESSSASPIGSKAEDMRVSESSSALPIVSKAEDGAFNREPNPSPASEFLNGPTLPSGPKPSSRANAKGQRSDALQPGTVWIGEKTYRKGGYAGHTVSYYPSCTRTYRANVQRT